MGLVLDADGPIHRSLGQVRSVAVQQSRRAAPIKVGFLRDEVLQALGKPHSRVSGDYEKFSYLPQSGKTFSLEFEAGRVAQVRIVTPN